MFLLLVAAPWAGAEAEQRVALVIGNGAYHHAGKLANPANDARAIAGALAASGFSLIGGGAQLDLDKARMEQAIREFGRRLGHDTIGLFYYAGHGIQLNGSNYLIPVSANIAGEADVKYELVDAAFVLDEMTEAHNRLNLVILDACRNNPFSGRGLRAVRGGLAQVTAPAGTLIGYATQPGAVAADGDDGHSPYTTALVRAIARPKLDVFATFNTVGLEVEQTTGGRQQPWVATSPIAGQFYFSELTETVEAAAPASGAEIAAPAPA
ncbi:MAG TPA: caspase family protein, partial [Stellaceae bacterium]|nr:caspase family protein [Stellaceae bacterium]